MKLIVPSIDYQQSYLWALEESKMETGVTVLKRPIADQPFAEFVTYTKEEAQGLHLPEGWVPASELWLVDGNEFIGTTNIRHSLTDHLLQIGGHISYWIRPSKRKRGYGKKLLKLALLEAKKLGITKVLVTCDDTNIGSQKIIEANGGILENVIPNGEDNPPKRRYWIAIE